MNKVERRVANAWPVAEEELIWCDLAPEMWAGLKIEKDLVNQAWVLSFP